jgi:hypothetical protein
MSSKCTAPRAVISLWVKVVALTRVTSLSIKVALMTTSSSLFSLAPAGTDARTAATIPAPTTNGPFRGKYRVYFNGKTVSSLLSNGHFVVTGLYRARNGREPFWGLMSCSYAGPNRFRFNGFVLFASQAMPPRRSGVFYQSVSNCGHILRKTLSRLLPRSLSL